MSDSLLVLNSGSASLKFALFSIVNDENLKLIIREITIFQNPNGC